MSTNSLIFRGYCDACDVGRRRQGKERATATPVDTRYDGPMELRRAGAATKRLVNRRRCGGRVSAPSRTRGWRIPARDPSGGMPVPMPAARMPENKAFELPRSPFVSNQIGGEPFLENQIKTTSGLTCLRSSDACHSPCRRLQRNAGSVEAPRRASLSGQRRPSRRARS